MKIIFFIPFFFLFLGCAKTETNNNDEEPYASEGEGRYWVISEPPFLITYLNEEGIKTDTLIESSSWKYIYKTKIGDSAYVKVTRENVASILIDLHFAGGSYKSSFCIEENKSDYCEVLAVVDWYN